MCEAFLSLYIRTIEMKLLLVSRNLRLIGGKIGVNYKLQVLVLNEKVKRQVARSIIIIKRKFVTILSKLYTK